MIVGGLGFGFGVGIGIGGFFGGGWGGWGGWGWHPAWGSHTVIVNNTFIHRYNFNTAHRECAWIRGLAARSGVPRRSALLQRATERAIPRERARQLIAARGASGPAGEPIQGERFGNRSVPQNQPPARNGSAFGDMGNGNAARQQADHGYSSLGPARTGGGFGGRSAPPRAAEEAAVRGEGARADCRRHS